jgi:hypothetical protein
MGSNAPHAISAQQEWRFIWLPDTDLDGDLLPIEFPIGPFSDIAILERLKPSIGESIIY